MAMPTLKNLNKQLGNYVNLYKYKWVNGWQCQFTENKSIKKKEHLIYVIELSK